MTESAETAGAPPPYRHDSHASETILPSTSPLTVVSGSNIEGIRNSILDNVPILFILGHRGGKVVPKEFKVVTVKAAPNVSGFVPHLIHGCVMFSDTASKGRQEAKLFVQGPQCETTEQALLALLEKTQEMLGRRWQLPLHGPRPGPPGQIYLES